MTINTYASIINLNVNGLNAPVKRHRVVSWMEKQEPKIFCLQEICLTAKDTHRLKVEGGKRKFMLLKMIFKKAGSAILISDKRLFKKSIKK